MALPDAMAEMIPETLPASSTAGEKRVFATLTRLPDDCLIYYEPVVRRRYPDLIAILPEVGVLVIEVKDWRLAELGSVNADTVTITRRGTATVVTHPRRQAREYMLRLMDECRRHPQAGVLMEKEGRHAGGYAFPFCHIAVLSNINRGQIAREAQELTLVSPRHDHHPRRTGHLGCAGAVSPGGKAQGLLRSLVVLPEGDADANRHLPQRHPSRGRHPR
jgi:Nuclease-related domain